MAIIEPRISNTVDNDEISHFDSLAQAWWDEGGAFKSLHKLNPTRVKYIRDHSVKHFQQSLKNLTILDVGCGGGLLTEPLARMGAQVTGIDASIKNIQVAKDHAQKQALTIDYQAVAAETLSAKFDIVTCMEVIEHVASVDQFLATCCKLVKPGGILFLSTLNRTLKSYLLGIIAAEYILGWVPKGTHQWQKFMRPQELEKILRTHNFGIHDLKGVNYAPLSDEWLTTEESSVNYMLCAQKNE